MGRDDDICGFDYGDEVVIMKKVKVWECKIIVDEDAELPVAFDNPPRQAAINAIEKYGIKVIGCYSGWGGTLTKEEKEAFNAQSVQSYPDIYFTGIMDIPDDVKH